MGTAYRLFTKVDEGKRSVALMEDSTLLEFYQEDDNVDGIVGTIYLGRVERVLPDVKAAFVKIGLKQNGFLPIKESESFHRSPEGNKPLMSGEQVLVQAKKAPKGGKGAFLTRDIALPGQYVLVMPCNRFVGLSKRIEDNGEREYAKNLGRKIAADRFGVIVRHAALFVSEHEVQLEADALFALWNDLSRKAEVMKAPAVMHTEAPIAEILARDYSARHKVEQSDDFELWHQFDIERQLKEAIGRRVELKGGGSLIIDEREALQTIDVNSGSAVKAASDMSLALEENLRAVPEIARQIRLRNLSGIILVDFIDMETDAEREKVRLAMETAIADDRVKNVIHGFTRLGLLEMTRKRTGDSLRDLLTTPCSKCCETGRLPNG